MTLKRSLLIFFAVALPIAALRFGMEWAESIPAETSSIPIVDRSYLVLREVVMDGGRRPDGVTDEDFTLQLAGKRYLPVGEPIIDLGHMDAGSARMVVTGNPNDDERALRVKLTREGTRRLAEWSESHISQEVGLFVDGELVCSAVVMDKLGGTLTIGRFAPTVAEQVLRQIRAGGAPGD